jgi:hypothetical protein
MSNWRLAPLVSVLALGACASVLGIEDIHDTPDPSASGGSQSGGATAPSGGSSTSPQAGSSATSAGTQGNGGNAATQGGNASNEGGSPEGGAPPVASPDVNGHLVDIWGHAVPNIPIQIGDTITTTAADGAFSAPNVPASYDVSLVVDYVSGFTYSFAWVFQGLTRRDPTLQIRSGFASHTGGILISPKNLTVDVDQTYTVALAGPDGEQEFTGVEGNGVDTETSWKGPPTTQETAHGLYWQLDPDTELPTKYLGYDTALIALAETGKATITLDAVTKALPSGIIQGTVTPKNALDRENRVFARFTSGATIELLDQYLKTPDTFSYLVPTLPNSTITVAASVGTFGDGAYAVAHKDGLAAAGVAALQIPTPITLLLPANDLMNVDGKTKFSFQPGAHSGPYVVHFENTGPDFNQYLYIVTSKTEVTIPEVVSGAFKLHPSNPYAWGVETHANKASMDAATGAAGFFDSFNAGSPRGPQNVDGEYTDSAGRGFTAAP